MGYKQEKGIVGGKLGSTLTHPDKFVGHNKSAND